MRRFALLLCACGLLAACGSDEGSSGFEGELRNDRLGYSLRYPGDWKGSKGVQQNDVRALQGPDGRECLVVPVLGLPDWSSERSRRAYYDKIAEQRELDVRETDSIDGANAEGITTVTKTDARDDSRLVRSTTFADGGVGVTISCSAPEDEFAAADREAFEPMAESVKLRINPRAEKLQARLAGLPDVEAAGITISGDRARAQMRVATREAGLPAVKQALTLLVGELDAGRIGVQALKDPANPVIGNWDARTERAFVQALPDPPQRYELRR